MRVINENEVAELLDMKELMDVLEDTFVEYSSGRTKTPLRIHMELDPGEGTGLIMPSWLEIEKHLGVKSVCIFPGNPKKNLPAIQGTMQLFDGETGAPISIMGAHVLTKYRTGASSGVAARYLTPKSTEEAAIIGTGGQAFEQLKAMVVAVPGIKRINLHNRTIDKARRFKNAAEQLFPEIEFRVMESAARAVKEAQLITTCTNSIQPVFQFRDMGEEKVHVNAVGAFKPNMQEIDTEVILAADKIIVDNMEGALTEAGDLYVPLNEEDCAFTRDDVNGEIGEVIAGGLSGRKGEDGVTLYESVGMGCLDVAAAFLVYQRAVKAGIGTHIEW